MVGQYCIVNSASTGRRNPSSLPSIIGLYPRLMFHKEIECSRALCRSLVAWYDVRGGARLKMVIGVLAITKLSVDTERDVVKGLLRRPIVSRIIFAFWSSPTRNAKDRSPTSVNAP